MTTKLLSEHNSKILTDVHTLHATINPHFLNEIAITIYLISFLPPTYSFPSLAIEKLFLILFHPQLSFGWFIDHFLLSFFHHCRYNVNSIFPSFLSAPTTFFLSFLSQFDFCVFKYQATRKKESFTEEKKFN